MLQSPTSRSCPNIEVWRREVAASHLNPKDSGSPFCVDERFDPVLQEMDGSTPSLSLGNSPALSSYRSSPSGRRTAVPSRTQRFDILDAEPSIRFRQPTQNVSLPERVQRVYLQLLKDQGVGVIPMALKNEIKAASDAHTLLPDYAFATTEHPDCLTLASLWSLVLSVYDEGRKAQEGSEGEGEWFSLARRVLLAIPSQRLELVNMQTAVLSPITLLPVTNGRAIQPRKVDLALAFSADDRTVAATYARVRHMVLKPTLSQTSDAKARGMALLANVEVKSSAGDYLEASVQIGTWVAAGLEKLRLLATEFSGTEYACDQLWPLPCWTVVGHTWSLHIAYKERDGTVIVQGPFPSGGTATHLDILILLDTIRRVHRYAEQYWAWFQRDILSLGPGADF
ncbi:MAG: hypothetical protein M1832_006415 [Thelocarpon impressellum]|nr:MAG: hypothetical protein M1832_006415 [Thelocarpon impressellum]